MHYSKFDIQQDDTLETPHHIDKRFEAVVANPPFSADWSASASFLIDERFSDYGKLAPAGKADFAFVQHMFYQLEDNGTMAVVLPHGVLFRSGAEGHIRQFLIDKKNCLDSVIGLPANLFFGASIATCILILKKQREHKDNVLFIDSSAYFEKGSNQNYLRDEDIDRIMAAVDKREFVDKFAHVALLDEIKENDFNLNIPRYVDTFIEEAAVNISEVSNSLNCMNVQLEEVDIQVADFCKELSIDAPFEVKE